MARTSREIRDALDQGRYKEAYRLCEKQRAAGDAPAEIYFLAACALFGLGHVHQAGDWVREHGQLTDQGPDFLYLQAYLRLHSRNFREALLDYTRILQLDPSRTLADELIEKLKEGEDRVFREISDPANFVHYVPLRARAKKNVPPAAAVSGTPTGSPGKSRAGAKSFPLRGVGIALGIIVLAGVGMGLLFAYAPDMADMFARFRGGKASFPGRGDLPDVPARGTVIPREQFGDAPPRFIYEDRDAALKEFKRARAMIVRGAVNQARYLLGKIELSNAGFEIKERALLLRDVIPDVQREKFLDPVEIKAVHQEPYLFRGAQVIWTGVADDVRRGEKGLEFKLMRTNFPEAPIRVSWPSRRQTAASQAPEKITDGTVLRVFGIFREKDNRGVLKVEALEILPAEKSRPPGQPAGEPAGPPANQRGTDSPGPKSPSAPASRKQ